MRAFDFILEIARKFPLFFIGNVLMLVVANLVGVASFLSIAPVTDLFLNPDLENISDMTRKVIGVVEWAGFSASLKTLLAIFLGFQVLKRCDNASRTSI